MLKARSTSLEPLEFASKNIHLRHRLSFNAFVHPAKTPLKKSRLVQLIDEEMNLLIPKAKNSLPVSTLFYQTQEMK